MLHLRKEKNLLRDDYLKHEEVVKIVESEDYKNLKKTNPLVFVGNLVYGCFSLLISFAMILHTLFQIVPRKNNWDDSLNTF